jgi:multiple sugar transport system substrate-binding protein
MRRTTSRSASAALAALGLLAGATACSGGGSGDSADSGTYVFWDPYPQFGDDSDWVRLVERCGQEAGVTVKRSAFDTSDLTNRALLAAQQGNAPDIIVLDNPVVSTLAEAGILAPADDLGLDVSGISENLLAAGQIEGETYGVPIGANTLALYYNAEVLTAAGVDPASITDWEGLNAALEAVTAAGDKGITFSAIGTEEGSFQFLPWFWGAGADLRELNSPQAVAAVSQWKDWLDDGYAPNSVINNTQTTSWQEFATGEYAFAVNGTWQLGNADASGIDYGVLPIPAETGGSAAAPTGGEFVTAPVQSGTGRYEATAAITECLTSGENLLATDATLSYVAPTENLQDQQVADDAALQPWVEAVRSARGRTSDGLGTDYPVISEQLWTAVQNVLSGAQSPQDALDAAQEAAAADTAD